MASDSTAATETEAVAAPPSDQASPRAAGTEVAASLAAAEPHETAAPPAKPSASRLGETIFQGESFSAEHDEISFTPATADSKDRTVDVVWYGGATVPRYDAETDTDYMLRLNMAGCRMERLNAGAPVFDCHMSGLDFRSIVANQAGAKAQRGTVLKAWGDGPKGLATLQFGAEGENADTDQLWSGIASGRIRNLSFGTWVYEKRPAKDANGNGTMMPHPSGKQAPVFEATDWEPFEISAVTVPADFSTQFLSALGADGQRATSPHQETIVMEKTTQTGAEARTEKVVLDAARAEGATLERQRVSAITALADSFKCQTLGAALVASGATADEARIRFAAASEIRTIGTPHIKHGLTTEFLDGLVNTAATLDAGRAAILEELAKTGARTTEGTEFHPRTTLSITSDEAVTQAQRMQAALLLRNDLHFFEKRYGPDHGPNAGKFLSGCGDAEQRMAEDGAREFMGLSLPEMGRMFLEARGVRTAGWPKMRLADELFRRSNIRSGYELFEGGAESSSDFPAILANVANKTLRQAYQAYAQTFKPFCRQVTASDFKPINRVQLSDAPALAKLNEKGEYHRAQLKDSNVSYALATYGEIVALTRKVIINDDLGAFTRVPGLLGQAAARMQSDTVWGVITANPSAIYSGDTASTALFAAAHKNYTASGAALAIGTLGTGRTNFRLQTAPQGTPLNLLPRYLVHPAALETTVGQLIYPMQLAVTAVTAGVPEWVRSMVPITEPRLDANSATAWYLIADPADIDTIEYCFLEGQEGVYFETRQGFEVDGIEMKARMDFAAAAIEYRGMAKYVG